MRRRERLHAALEHPNVRAFLRAIRLGEGTSDPLGYRRIVGGGEFESYAEHPRPKVYLPILGGKYSSAAGAYQFIWPTWSGLAQKFGFGDFSPSAQDEGAVALIEEKNALDDVKNGRIREAIHKVRNVWASLPGSEHGQRTEKLASVLDVYRDHGGTVAT